MCVLALGGGGRVGWAAATGALGAGADFVVRLALSPAPAAALEGVGLLVGACAETGAGPLC